MATSSFLVPIAFHQLEDVPIRLAGFEGSRALKAEMLGVKRLLRDEIRDHQAARMSATSANFSVKVVRNAFKAAIRERLLSENPSASISSIRSSGGRRIIGAALSRFLNYRSC